MKSFWDNFKPANIHMMRAPGEGRKQGIDNQFEKVMTENFSNLVKDIDIQLQEAQRAPNTS